MEKADKGEEVEVETKAGGVVENRKKEQEVHVLDGRIRPTIPASIIYRCPAARRLLTRTQS